MVPNFEEIPEDCIFEILSYCDEQTLCKLSLSLKNSKFSKLSSTNKFWKIIFQVKYDLPNFPVKVNTKHEFGYKMAVRNVYLEVEKYFSDYHPQKKFKFVESTLLLCLFRLIKDPPFLQLRVTILGDRLR
jgi:hypothetical protein